MKHWLRRVTEVHSVAFLFFLALMTYYASTPIADPDVPWHIATGTYILQHHTIPTTDMFSWSSLGKAWVTQEWGFEVVLAFLAHQFGFLGLVFLNVVVAAATAWVVYRVSLYYTRTNKVAAVIVGWLSVFAAFPFWIDRPQIASYLLFAVFLWILEQVRRGKYIPLAFAPVLIWGWANLHASSIIGVLMLLFEVVLSFVPGLGRIEPLQLPKGARWRLVASGLAGAVTGLLTPLGIKSYEYTLLSGSSELAKHIAEWNAPNFQEGYYAHFFVPILFIVGAVVVIRKQSQPLKAVIYAAGACYLMLMHQRFMPYFTIALALVVAANASGLGKAYMTIHKRVRILNGIIGIVLVAAIAGLAVRSTGNVSSHFSRSAYPVGAVSYMKQHHLTRNILNSYAFGGYLIYEGIPTFVDGRTDIFLKDGVYQDYLDLREVKSGAQNVLNKYPFQAAVLSHGSPIEVLLRIQGDWQRVYKSDVADVYVKNPTK